MSQENAELTQRAYDAFNQRDIGVFLALMDADVEAESRLVAMEGGYHGHDGIRHWWQNGSTRSRTSPSKRSRRARMGT